MEEREATDQNERKREREQSMAICRWQERRQQGQHGHCVGFKYEHKVGSWDNIQMHLKWNSDSLMWLMKCMLEGQIKD